MKTFMVQEEGESPAIKECENLLGGAGSWFAVELCDKFVKEELDAILAHLEDPDARNDDATVSCQDMGACPSSITNLLRKAVQPKKKVAVKH